MKKIILLILLAFFLVGCNDNNDEVDDEPIIPSTIEIINPNIENEVVVDEVTIGLLYVTVPSYASQEVVWSSSNPEIAIVTENGEVIGVESGSVVIRATSYYDQNVYGEIEITVYNDNRSEEIISNINNYLDEIIPEYVDSNYIELPLFYEDDIRLSWSSSNNDTISRTGQVIAARDEKYVTLTATFTVERIEGEFSKTIQVSPYQLKSRENKRLIFTYLYDAGSFTGFRPNDLEMIDVINLSFWGIIGGKVSVLGLKNRAQIVTEAHEAGTRVVLAIGGWGVDGFSQAVRTSETREKFIDSIIDCIIRYRFDGIDIDWEYPLSTAGGLIEAHPNDPKNLTSFLRDLRIAMDEVNPDLILSIAVSNGSWAANNCYEVEKINEYIDFMHLMSYDLIDRNITGHHTNLYKSNNSISSAENGVNAYLNLKLDRNKLIMGVAFYGYIFNNIEPNDNENGIGVGAEDSTTISFSKIKDQYINSDSYQVYYDEVAKANWIYGNNIFISYESPDSIQAKAEYVINNNLGGLMAWQYTHDDSDSTLLKAMYNNLYTK